MYTATHAVTYLRNIMVIVKIAAVEKEEAAEVPTFGESSRIISGFTVDRYIEPKRTRTHVFDALVKGMVVGESWFTDKRGQAEALRQMMVRAHGKGAAAVCRDTKEGVEGWRVHRQEAPKV